MLLFSTGYRLIVPYPARRDNRGNPWGQIPPAAKLALAGRIRERFHKPAFVLTDAVQEAKGSGRSIEAYHMYEELNRCSEYLTKFGGHKLAAGFSLKKEYIGLLRQKLNENCVLTEEEMAQINALDRNEKHDWY